MNTALKQMIAEREAQLEELEEEREAILAEIKLLSEALKRSPQTSDEPEIVEDPKYFDVNPLWASVLKFIGQKKNAHISVIQDFAHSVGLKISTPDLQSKLSKYVISGWLAQIGGNFYSLTSVGAEKIGFNKAYYGIFE